jgi:hypothetical protein
MLGLTIVEENVNLRSIAGKAFAAFKKKGANAARLRG